LTRQLLVESILLLCLSGRKAREQLRLERVYVILKLADMVEEHEDVSEVIEECVQYLRRDEHGTAEGSSDQFVEDAYRKPVAARQVGVSEDLEDID
jgi:replicative superfamily II helicase